MNIALAYDVIYPFHRGGGERRYWEVARRLAAHGHRVTMCGLQQWDGPALIEREGVTIQGVGANRQFFVNGRRSISTALYMARRHYHALRSDKFDVLDVGEFPFFPVFSAKLVSLQKRTPLVVNWFECWGKYWYEYLGAKGIAGWVIERQAAHLPRALIVETKSNQDQLVSWGIKRERIAVIPSGVSYDWIQSVPAQEKRFDVIFVGRLITAKGCLTFVRTVAELKKNKPHIRAAVIGDGPERAGMDKLAKELGVEGAIEFFGPVEEEETKIAVMKSARVFLYAAVPEGGWALSALEANACGLPVVSARSGPLGINEVVLDGQSGMLADREDPALLAAKVDILLSNTETMKRLGDGAQAFALRHDWDSVAKAFEDVYVSILPSARQRRLITAQKN